MDRKFEIEILVDEDHLRDITEDKETSIEGLIDQEAGWMNQSGISVCSIKEVENKE